MSFSVIEGEPDRIIVSCECNYIYRMNLPCRHLLVMALKIDKDENKIGKYRLILAGKSLMYKLVKTLVSQR